MIELAIICVALNIWWIGGDIVVVLREIRDVLKNRPSQGKE